MKMIRVEKVPPGLADLLDVNSVQLEDFLHAVQLQAGLGAVEILDRTTLQQSRGHDGPHAVDADVAASLHRVGELEQLNDVVVDHQVLLVGRRRSVFEQILRHVVGFTDLETCGLLEAGRRCVLKLGSGPHEVDRVQLLARRTRSRLGQVGHVDGRRRQQHSVEGIRRGRDVERHFFSP